MEKESKIDSEDYDDDERKGKKDEEESLFCAQPKCLGTEFGIVLHHTSFKVSDNTLQCETFLESTYLGEIPILSHAWMADSGVKGFDDPDVQILMIPVPEADSKDGNRESKGGKGNDSDSDSDGDLDGSFSSLDDDKYQADEKESKRHSDSKPSEKK